MIQSISRLSFSPAPRKKEDDIYSHARATRAGERFSDHSSTFVLRTRRCSILLFGTKDDLANSNDLKSDSITFQSPKRPTKMKRLNLAILSIVIVSSLVQLGCGGGSDAPIPVVAGKAPTITKEPEPATTLTGGQIILSATVLSDAPVSYQWTRNKENLVNGSIPSGPCSQAIIAGANSTQLVVSKLPLSCDLSAFSMLSTNATGMTTTKEAVVRVAGFTSNPLSTSAFANGSALFKVDGSLLDQVALRWKLYESDLVDGKILTGPCSGASIANSTTQSLTVENIPGGCDGSAFSLRASLNSAELTSQTANLAVAAITAQPSVTAVAAGGLARFNIATSGSSALQYLWSLNGVPAENGLATTGGCAGAVFSGVNSSTLEVSNTPLGCDAALVTVKLTNTLNSSILSGSAALNVFGIRNQPVAFNSYANGKATFTVTTAGTPATSGFVWKLNGTTLTTGLISSGICSGATVSGANTNVLVLTDIPLTCDSAQVFASVSNSVGALNSSIASLKVAPADTRSGTYKSFAVDGQMYSVKVDFDGNLYEVKAPSGESIPGTLTPNTNGQGQTEAGTYAMSAPNVIAFGGAFRYADDVIVGNLPPSSAFFFKRSYCICRRSKVCSVG
jgi:hypothetical protein